MARLKFYRATLSTWLTIFLLINFSKSSYAQGKAQKIEFFFEQTDGERCNSALETTSLVFESAIPDAQQALGSAVDLTGIQQIRVTGSWVLYSEKTYGGKTNVFPYDGCYVIDKTIPTIQSARFLGNSDASLPGLSIFPSQSWPNGPMVYYDETDKEINLAQSPICVASWGTTGMWTFFSGPNFSGLSKCRSGWGNNGFFQVYSIKQGCERSATLLDGRNETQSLDSESEEDNKDKETRLDVWVSCRPGVIAPITIPVPESTSENGQDVETSTDSGVPEPEKKIQKIEFFFEQTGADRCNSDAESVSMIFNGPIPDAQETLGSAVDLTEIQQIRVTGAWVVFSEENYEGKANVFPYDGCFAMDRSVPTIKSARFLGNSDALLPGLSIFPSRPWPNGPMVYYGEKDTEIDLGFSPICIAAWGTTGYWTFYSGPNFSGISKCRRGWGNDGYFLVYSIKQGCDRSSTLLDGRNETQSLADGETREYWVSCRPGVIVPITIPPPESTSENGQDVETSTDSEVPEPEKKIQKIEFFFEQTGTDRCNSDSESVSLIFDGPIPDAQQALGSAVDLTGIQQIRVTGAWVVFSEPNYEGKANVFPYDGCFVMDRSVPTIKSARFLGNSDALLPGLSIFPSRPWPNGPMVYYGEKDTEIDLGFSPICIAAWGTTGYWTFYSGPNFSGISKCRRGWGNDGYFLVYSIKQGCDRSLSDESTLLDGRNATQALADGETREYWISCRPGVIVPITIPTPASTSENGQDLESSTDSGEPEPEKKIQKIEFFFEQSGTERCNSDAESVSMVFERPIPDAQQALGSAVDLAGIQQIRVTGAWILYAEPNYQGKTSVFPYDGCYVMDKTIPTIRSARFFGNSDALLPGLSIFPSQPWPNGPMVYYDEKTTEIDLAFSPICIASWGSTGFWSFYSGPNFSGLSKCRRGWGNNGYFLVYSIKQGCDRSATLMEERNETQSLALADEDSREPRVDLWVSCRPAVIVPITSGPETTTTSTGEERTSTINPEPETSTAGESAGEQSSTPGESGGEITSSAPEEPESSTANNGVTEEEQDESTESTTPSSASQFHFSTIFIGFVLFVPILSHFY